MIQLRYGGIGGYTSYRDFRRFSVYTMCVFQATCALGMVLVIGPLLVMKAAPLYTGEPPRCGEIVRAGHYSIYQVMKMSGAAVQFSVPSPASLEHGYDKK